MGLKSLIPSEQSEHLTLARWLDLNRILWAHPPNGGGRSKIEGAILKGMGVKRGLPDVLIFDPVPSPLLRLGAQYFQPGAAIELKTASGRVTPEQRQWLVALSARGWATNVCYSAREAIEWLMSLGYGRK